MIIHNLNFTKPIYLGDKLAKALIKHFSNNINAIPLLLENEKQTVGVVCSDDEITNFLQSCRDVLAILDKAHAEVENQEISEPLPEFSWIKQLQNSAKMAARKQPEMEDDIRDIFNKYAGMTSILGNYQFTIETYILKNKKF
jgi:hypothetical protein